MLRASKPESPIRTLKQFLDAYALSHQNPLNQIIHVICVPAIFFATLGLLWLVPIGRAIPGAPADLAHWINAATVLMPIAGLFYGHHVEGAKPSFADDILFLLIGPLFAQHKLHRLTRTAALWPQAGSGR
ncbi:MAG: Mpo1-like protein [Panacagrimonas sp.]